MNEKFDCLRRRKAETKVTIQWVEDTINNEDESLSSNQMRVMSVFHHILQNQAAIMSVLSVERKECTCGDKEK